MSQNKDNVEWEQTISQAKSHYMNVVVNGEKHLSPNIDLNIFRNVAKYGQPWMTKNT